MITPELITFIKQQLSAGVSREQISQTLQKNGWTSADIGEAFTQAMPPAPIVPPAPTVPPIVQNNYQPTMPTTNPANQYRPVAQQPIIQPIIIQPNVAQPNMNQPVQMQPVMSAQGNTKWMVWAIILIVLAGIGYAGWVFKDQITEFMTKAQIQKDEVEVSDGSNLRDNKIILNDTIYNSPELGFSFVSPYGQVKLPMVSGPDGSQYESPLITNGDTGQSMRAYISYDPLFYIAGMTANYTAGRDIDCGEAKSYPALGEIVNAKGTKYVYEDVITDEMQGPYKAAYFKLNKGPIPVLGFCGIGMSEADFKKVIDTVVIQG